MNESVEKTTASSDADETFVEGLDFYFENGMMVLTKRYLTNRGFCCGSGCRHCPYDSIVETLE